MWSRSTKQRRSAMRRRQAEKGRCTMAQFQAALNALHDAGRLVPFARPAFFTVPPEWVPLSARYPEFVGRTTESLLDEVFTTLTREALNTPSWADRLFPGAWQVRIDRLTDDAPPKETK